MFVLSNWTKRFLKNLLGILLIVGIFYFFFWAVLETPVMELNQGGKCLRVLNEKGTAIPNGCGDAKSGKLATDHRYVRR